MPKKISINEAKTKTTAHSLSNNWDEDGEDFSDSSSDWVPSDEETESCDSDAEVGARQKVSLKPHSKEPIIQMGIISMNESKEKSEGFKINKNRKICPKNAQNNEEGEELVPIGSGMTLIPRHKYETINWKSYTIATRTLLVAVFPRRILATHSLTGKSSPAFQNKPAKMILDQRKISDVITEVVDRFKVRHNLVRNIITIKCADECKMWKTRCNKNASKNKENTKTV